MVFPAEATAHQTCLFPGRARAHSPPKGRTSGIPLPFPKSPRVWSRIICNSLPKPLDWLSPLFGDLVRVVLVDLAVIWLVDIIDLDFRLHENPLSIVLRLHQVRSEWAVLLFCLARNWLTSLLSLLCLISSSLISFLSASTSRVLHFKADETDSCQCPGSGGIRKRRMAFTFLCHSNFSRMAASKTSLSSRIKVSRSAMLELMLCCNSDTHELSSQNDSASVMKACWMDSSALSTPKSERDPSEKSASSKGRASSSWITDSGPSEDCALPKWRLGNLYMAGTTAERHACVNKNSAHCVFPNQSRHSRHCKVLKI